MSLGGSDSTAFQHYAASAPGAKSEVVAFPRSAGRVALQRHSAAEWSTALGERFNALTALPAGWDGYEGRPVSFTCARFAAQLLARLFDPEIPPPSLVPGSDGTLQIEWHINQYDVEIDISAPFRVAASRFDCINDTIEEVELETDFSILAQWLSELKTPRAMERSAGAA